MRPVIADTVRSIAWRLHDARTVLAAHARWHSPARRVLIDSHDLRLGVFWVPRGEHAPGHCWLHLPGVVIDLSRKDRS